MHGQPLHDLTVISEVNSLLENLAEKITNKEFCGAYAYIKIIKLTLYVLYKKYVCGIHYLATRDVYPATCNICPLIFQDIFNR